jgi:hypothetical protein
MALSRCPHCKGGRFEVVLKEPAGSAFKMNFAQCSTCGAPFGIVDYFNLGTLLKKQEKKVEELDRRLSSIESTLQQIVQALRR